MGVTLGSLLANVFGGPIAQMQGVDVGSGDLAGDICARAYDKGLVIETSGADDEVVKVLAPLTTPDDTFRKGFAILLDAAREVTETNKIAAE